MDHQNTKQTASSWLQIDLQALAANYNICGAQATKTCAVAGIIKADAYGLGAEKVVAALDNQSCPLYFVATLDEALKIRPLTAKPVAVLGGLYHGAEELYIHENLVPVLNSLEEIKRWQALAARHEIPLQALVHFDTGMNRLGLGPDETQQIHENPAMLQGLHILYMMSHFACADNKDHQMNDSQYHDFIKATEPFPAIKKSLCNSSGIWRSADYHFDLLRPGMAVYGLNPTPEAASPMRPVISLQSRILQVRTVKKGETIGYSATYRFEKDTHTATVALGYADGYLRSLSSHDVFYYKGTACPVVGRISMDVVSVDIGHINPLPAPGETMEIIGPHHDVDAVAAAAGTIGHEVLTALSRRYHRSYL